MKGIEITVRDLETGESESQVIDNDYVIVAAGRCEVSGIQTFANGTHILTVKNAGGAR